jgi:crossover junction endodeoxyribonuclease RuvC
VITGTLFELAELAETVAPAAAPAEDPATARVVGIDPSLTGTGIATTLGYCYKVGRDGVTKLPLDERLAAVDELADQIVRHVGQPELVVIEEPAFSRAAGGAMERHALWWLVVRKLRSNGLAVAVAPISTRMRYATGKGSATKSAVVDAVARRLPLFATGGDEDLADAAVLCAMGADRLGEPLAALPATHRAALDAVKWPKPVRGAA